MGAKVGLTDSEGLKAGSCGNGGTGHFGKKSRCGSVIEH
jgi:hypothetical protein